MMLHCINKDALNVRWCLLHHGAGYFTGS
jgi:hypothetical protein